jgi:Alginate export
MTPRPQLCQQLRRQLHRKSPRQFFVPGLVLMTSVAVSVSATAADAPGPTIIGGGGDATEIIPGKLQGGGRQVYIQGLLDLDALQQSNYTDGNSDHSDHRSEGWYRAELGTRIAIDSRVEVQVTVAGQGVMGNGRATENGLIYSSTTPSPTTNAPANGYSGNAVIDDAFVKLKDFLGYRELAIDAGRQPVQWNLRRDHGAFLYDSRSNYQTITSWDGLRAAYNWDDVNITPYLFRMPDNSQLYGLTLDWEPAKSGDQRLFFTGSANLERNVLLQNGGKGESLQTYYVGADADFTDFELYGEFAMQAGDQNDTTKFGGYAFSGGLDWHLDQIVLGLQYDHSTGDDNTTDGKNKAFINNWEAVSDTYIVENEKYGELSRLMQGNLIGLKGKFEMALDSKKRVRIKTVYAYYKTDKSSANGSDKFGQELDLHVAWDFTKDSTITLFGGIFKPEGVYKDVAPVDNTTTPASVPSDDFIHLIGANLAVKF